MNCPFALKDKPEAKTPIYPWWRWAIDDWIYSVSPAAWLYGERAEAIMTILTPF